MEHFVRVSANMIVAESSVLTIKPELRRCYLSKEKPLAFFKYYTEVSAVVEHSTRHPKVEVSYLNIGEGKGF